MNILYTIINPSGISLIEINLFTNFDIIVVPHIVIVIYLLID